MPRLQITTPYSEFVQKWQNCKECEYCSQKRNIVLARGQIPCDVLLVGEAPGASEDVLGAPFIGPAGKLLDQMLEKSGLDEFRLLFTNLVCCIPKDEDGSKMGEPTEKTIKACSERLREFVMLSKPKVVIAVGNLAKKWLPKLLREQDFEDSTSIIHPAAILRMDGSQQGLAIQRTVVAFRDVAEDLEK